MTNIEFYYNELWSATLKSVYESNQVSNDVYDLYFNGSKLVSLTDTEAIIAVPAFINYTIMNQHTHVIQNCLSEQLSGRYVEIKIILENDQKEKNHLSYKIAPFFDREIDEQQNFGNFVTGKSNMQAHVAALTCGNNPGNFYNPLFIYGNSGLGKTHLLNAIGNHIEITFPTKKIGFISAPGFIEALADARKNENIDEFKNTFYELDVLLVDDIQFLAGKGWTQEVFFSIFTRLVNNKKQICVTADRMPAEINGLEERIISRFNQGLKVNIESPEYETAIRILKLKIANSFSASEKVDEEVLSFIATNFAQDVRSLEGALNRLLFYYINFNFDNEDHISLNLAYEAFKEEIRESSGELDIVKIRKTVCNYYNLTKQQICSANRTKNIAIPRQIAMYLCRKILDASYKEIGLEFGNRDHSTVINACEKVEALLETNPSFVKAIEEIERQVK